MIFDMASSSRATIFIRGSPEAKIGSVAIGKDPKSPLLSTSRFGCFPHVDPFRTGSSQLHWTESGQGRYGPCWGQARQKFYVGVGTGTHTRVLCGQQALWWPGEGIQALSQLHFHTISCSDNEVDKICICSLCEKTWQEPIHALGLTCLSLTEGMNLCSGVHVDQNRVASCSIPWWRQTLKNLPTRTS